MPIKVKQEDGTEIEVLTQDEIDAKVKEESDRIANEKQGELDRITEERKSEQEELEKLRNKDMNFEKLRNKAEKGGESEEVKTQIAELNKKLDTIAQQPVVEVKNDFIKEKVGTEKEKVDLFEYYFKRLGSEAKTKEEVQKACNDALTLATNGQYQPSQDQRVTSTGVSQNYRNQNTVQVSEEAKEMGAMFGNTEKELSEHKKKKYGNN